MASLSKLALGNPSADNGLPELGLFNGEDNCQVNCQVFRNFTTASTPETGKLARTGRGLSELRSELLTRMGNWPRRLGRQLFVVRDDHEVVILDRPVTLFAWMQEHFQVEWVNGTGMISREEFFRSLQMHAEGYDAIEHHPHFPPLQKVCYLHADLPCGEKGRLKELLARFHPASKEDAELIKAFFLTLFWGGSAGSRPIFLFTSMDSDCKGGRGVGKSTVVEIASLLCGGIIEVEPAQGMSAVKSRLLSEEAHGRRVVRIDNLKESSFGWAELEALVTAPVISGKKLYQGEGRRPNNLVWTLTLNGASLSRDLAQRCVIIQLGRPVHKPSWKAETVQLIEEYRQEILANIQHELSKKGNKLDPSFSRWAAWEQDVLARVGLSAACQRLIRKRQDVVDSDADEADLVMAQFHQELRQLGHDPDRGCVFIPSGDAADWLKTATKQHRATNKATAYLGSLAIRPLTKTKKDGKPGWKWRGEKATAETMTWARQAAAPQGRPRR